MIFAKFKPLMLRDLEALTGAPAPAVFNAIYPVPLKLRIHLDILKRYSDVDLDKLNRFLCIWVQQGVYLTNLARGGARYNLDGKEAGRVTQEERKHADAQHKRAMRKPPKTIGIGGRPILKLKSLQQAAA